MAELLHSFTQVLLFLYCLKPTIIESKDKVKPLNLNEKEIATVSANSGGTPCLAVWISENCLLTAASCFDELGKRNFTENPDIDVTVITWNFAKVSKDKYNETTKYYKGEAIVHPHYKRKDTFTFAYDLAVVRVQKERRRWIWKFKKTDKILHETVNLCSNDEDSWQPTFEVYAEPSRQSREDDRSWQSDRRYNRAFIGHTWPDDFAVTSRLEVDHRGKTVKASKTEQVYYIDYRKQFTANSNPHVVFDVPIGGPVFATEKNCVAGIVNIVGERNDTVYVTSTKVYPVTKWIKFTRQYLKKDKSRRQGDKIYGTNGKAFWEKNNINLDPIGPSKENEPGNPLSKADWKELDRQERNLLFRYKQYVSSTSSILN